MSDHIDPNIRLNNLIDTLYKQTGKQVVVLIDEYDAPLLDVVHETAKLKVLREEMRNFYSPLKKMRGLSPLCLLDWHHQVLTT